MQYRSLGKTGLDVSVIGIGTWQFGGEWGKDFPQPEVDQMFDSARDLNYNLIDTAECYGDHTSERLVGQAIARDRHRWIVATKFGHKFHGHLSRTDERSAADVALQLEDSLRALQTDYIDLYQYHSVRDNEFDDAEVRDVLLRARQAGKIRHIGNSIASSDNVHQTAGAHEAHVETIQLVYNRLDRIAEKRVLPLCAQQGLGVLARVPLASGFLSGKYQPGAVFAASDVRFKRPRVDVDARLQEVQQIAQAELPPGTPMAQWALAWCLQNPAVTCVIPGCKSVQQVIDNARAGD